MNVASCLGREPLSHVCVRADDCGGVRQVFSPGRQRTTGLHTMRDCRRSGVDAFVKRRRSWQQPKHSQHCLPMAQRSCRHLSQGLWSKYHTAHVMMQNVHGSAYIGRVLAGASITSLAGCGPSGPASSIWLAPLQHLHIP